MRILLLSIILITSVTMSTAQVGINNTNPDASAALDVQSTSQGVLVPRMLESQRNLIPSPATGLLVYQTDTAPGFYFFDGTAWSSLSGGGGAVTAGTAEPDSLVIDAFSIEYDTIYVSDADLPLSSNTPQSFWGDKQHVIFLPGPGGLTQTITIEAISASRYDGRILSIRNRTSRDIDILNEYGYDPTPSNYFSSNTGLADLNGNGITEVIYDISTSRWLMWSVYAFE